MSKVDEHGWPEAPGVGFKIAPKGAFDLVHDAITAVRPLGTFLRELVVKDLADEMIYSMAEARRAFDVVPSSQPPEGAEAAWLNGILVLVPTVAVEAARAALDDLGESLATQRQDVAEVVAAVMAAIPEDW
jgi:hypothetical protein